MSRSTGIDYKYQCFDYFTSPPLFNRRRWVLGRKAFLQYDTSGSMRQLLTLQTRHLQRKPNDILMGQMPEMNCFFKSCTQQYLVDTNDTAFTLLRMVELLISVHLEGGAGVDPYEHFHGEGYLPPPQLQWQCHLRRVSSHFLPVCFLSRTHACIYAPPTGNGGNPSFVS